MSSGCPCEGWTPVEAETAVAVLLAKAQSLSVSPALPAICDIQPYPQGATDEQKLCIALRTLLMLARWLHCSAQSDPSACFEGECDDYDSDVNDCTSA